MIKKMIMFLLFAHIALTASAGFVIDMAHSSVGFSTTHMAISKVHGSFKSFSGTVAYDEKKDQITAITAEIDVNSIDTGNAKRDGHLKSPDFFDAEINETIVFTGSKIEKKGLDYTIYGNLTIKDVTLPIVIRGKETGKMGGRIGFSGRATINRMDYGLKWSRLTELGGLIVAKKVDLIFDIQIKKK